MESEKDKQASLNIYELSLFNKDPFLGFLYRKSQSLAAALYLVTDHFPTEEPLKWNIREQANLLLQSSLSFIFALDKDPQNISRNIISNSIEILSLIEIAALTKLVSDMNLRVLKTELENLLVSIEKKEEPLKLGINFPIDESIFKTDSSTTSSWTEEFKSREPQGKSQLPIKDKSFLSPVSKQSKGQNSIKDNANTPNSLDRKQLIINFLKDKDRQSIKDISQNFKDCSEKTIQRELIQMVQEGVLTKVGERRWSRYYLNS